MAKTVDRRVVYVYAHWLGLGEPALMGTLSATPVRGKEVFSFAYADRWLQSPHAQELDPSLQLYAGPQYLAADEQGNFGLFLDSAPDRWGRVLMDRREAQSARSESRRPRPLLESDYLLGVYDGHRLGGLRFKRDPEGPFLDDNQAEAAPPWASLRELEHVSWQLERPDAASDPAYPQWLAQLVAPGASLGGARPKASIVDQTGQLWIAKFPSRFDERNIGAWEAVVRDLAQQAGLNVAAGQAQRFGNRHHTFLSQRFDRITTGERRHYASALTLLGYHDGTSHKDGASYLHLAEFLQRSGASVAEDLQELWRRIVFNICVSNTDDHLRNHGFLLTPEGWRLSPAFDLNPVPVSYGLTLNISETDNALSLELAREVAPFFRLKPDKAAEIEDQVKSAARNWRERAGMYGISRGEQEEMVDAFARTRM
ncbi:MAG: HipA domain-containing protein [Bacteroidota bacterium]|nr:HipA domain-containing protein [Bacteroidota bacterium]